MTILQIDLIILVTITILNFLITHLYNKYNNLIESKGRGLDFGNKSVFTNITPGSFMPRVPFLILRAYNNNAVRKIVVAHNVLCFVVYGRF